MEAHRGQPKSQDIQRTDDLFRSRQRKRRPPTAAETEVANATLIKLQRKLEAQGELPPALFAISIPNHILIKQNPITICKIKMNIVQLQPC